MTLRDLLKTTRGSREVELFCGQERISGTSQSLLFCLSSRYLDDSVVEIMIDKFEILLVEICD